MRQHREIVLLIHCHTLPGIRFEERTQVRLGIQKGREVVEDVPAEGVGVTFRAGLRVSGTPAEPDFLGPFVHGRPGDRFLYLCWGERKSGEWDPFRRAKIRLNCLTWDRLDEAWGTGEPITLSLSMTDSRGGPVCGSVEVD